MKKKLLYTFLILIFSICISKILWSKINLPFNTEIEISGLYLQNNYNPINEILRYVIFLTIPLITFFLTINFFFKKQINNFKNILFLNLNYKNTENEKTTYYFLLTVIFLIFILSFMSTEFSMLHFDNFHEGQRFSPYINYTFKGGLWSSSYLTVGLFHEFLETFTVSKIFGGISISQIRFFDVFLSYIINFLTVLLAYQIAINQKFKSLYKILFFLFLNLAIIIFVYKNLHYRDFPILLFLNFLLFSFNTKSKSNIANFLIGTLSMLSMVWSVDKGVFLNFTLVFLIIFYLIRKEKQKVFSISLGIILSWLFLFIIMGKNEFNYFVNNTLEVLQFHQYVHGSIHPEPFSSMILSSRATKVLLMAILSGILIIGICFIKNKHFSNKLKIFYAFLFLTAFINYRTALGLSDSYHIRKSELYWEIILLSILLSFIFNFFSKKKSLINYNLSYKTTIVFLLAFTVLAQNVNFTNITNFGNRLEKYLNLPDKKFLTEEQFYSISKISKTLSGEKCIQFFTYEASIPFLTKKPSCSKFYMIWSIATNKNQNEFIKEMENSGSKFIVSNGPYEYFPPFSPSERFPIVQKYINDNFKLYDQINSYKIYIKNE